MSPYPWLTGHIIQAQYLNSLQEILSDYSDNVLLQATGAAVVVPATASATAELVVDGHLRTNKLPEVTELAGPAGVYNIFATANRSNGGFDILSTPTQAVAAHARFLGTADFNGAVVTEVHSAVREINVSHLDGHTPAELSTPNRIPAGRRDATLDPNWLDDIEYNMVPIGGVRELWVPSGASMASMIPSGWRLMNGQAVGPADHSFPGVATITLPNMFNRHGLGADPANIWGTPGTDAGVSPGIGGVGGSNEPRNLSHSHAVPTHTHSLTSHSHDMDHSHKLERHKHPVTLRSGRFRVATMSESVILESPETMFLVASAVFNFPTNNPPSNVDMEEYMPVGTTALNTGAESASTTGAYTSMATAPLGSVNFTPQNLGLAYMIRVQ